MSSVTEQGRSVIGELKSACCCPECGKYPCPPGSWYDASNPYIHNPKLRVQLGKVVRYFDNITDARAALASFNAKRTPRARA